MGHKILLKASAYDTSEGIKSCLCHVCQRQILSMQSSDIDRPQSTFVGTGKGC